MTASTSIAVEPRHLRQRDVSTGHLPTKPRSRSRTATSIGATTLLLALLAIGPTAIALAIVRFVFAQDIGPIGNPVAFGAVSAGIIASLGTAICIRRRERPLRPMPLVPSRAQAAVRRLIELSTFGVGPIRRWTTTRADLELERVAKPALGADRHLDELSSNGIDGRTLHTAVAYAPPAGLPPTAARPPTASTTIRRRFGRSSVATADSVAAVDLRHRATNVHRVTRGETFWSLA